MISLNLIRRLGQCPITGIAVNLFGPSAAPPTISRFEGFPPSLLTEKPAMLLQKVVHRKPVAFQPHAHVPDYLLCYCVETLACGHSLTTFPQADPLIAVRRSCHKCNDGQVLSPKKPCAAERNPRKKAA